MKKTSLFPLGVLVSHLCEYGFIGIIIVNVAHTRRVTPIAFLEHKCMIMNFMATHTNLLVLKLPAGETLLSVREMTERKKPFL